MRVKYNQYASITQVPVHQACCTVHTNKADPLTRAQPGRGLRGLKPLSYQVKV